MQFALLNKISLHYQVIEAPEGRPYLVFSNSLGTDFRIWRDLVVDLAGSFGFILYDKRGHGLSDCPEAPYEIEDHVIDLIELLDHLKISDVIICGLSVGGLIAQGLYKQRPDLVRALVLCDTAHKIGTAEMWNTRISQIEENGIEFLAEAILERWFSQNYRTTQATELAGYRNMLVRQPIAGYCGTCAAIRDTDFTDAAKNISVPTLCVVGDEDGATPPSLVQETANLIPDAAFEILSGAGHLPCIEKPKELAALLRRFIADIAA